MIANIEELIKSRDALWKKYGKGSDRIKINRPGCSYEETQRIIEAFPDFPKSYVDVISTIDIFKKCIGYFELSPATSKDISLPEALLACNSENENPF